MPNHDNLPATTSANANLPDHARRMQDLLGGISNIANSIADAGGVASAFPFIGINNSGVWAFGQDRTEVQKNSLWAIDIRTWQHGYIAWPPASAKERKPLGERMVPANSPLPNLADLPNVGHPYQLQFSFQLLCLTGEDRGTIAMFKNGSYGAKVAVQTLVDEVRKQARLDPSRLCPVVKLEIRSYFHNDWKKDIYNPVLAIQRWTTFDEYDSHEQKEPERALAADTVEDPPVQAAARGNGRRPAAEPEAPPPGRRRPANRTQPDA
jgi:hypothetical protein